MEEPGLWIGLVALVISLYAAVSARRSADTSADSADAARRSAKAAEEALTLQQGEIREAWINRLTEALPEGNKVTRLLADLPTTLREDWQQLVQSAAGRNPRTPPKYFRELQERFGDEWERAVQLSSPTTRRRRS